MANGDFLSLTRDGNRMLLKTSTTPTGFAFTLPGTSPAPAAPAPVVVDNSKVIADMRSDFAVRLTVMLEEIRRMGTAPPVVVPPVVDVTGWLSAQTLVPGGTVRLPSGIETASTAVIVAQTVIGKSMRETVLDGQYGVGAGHRLAYGKAVVYINGPFVGQDFGLIRGGKGDNKSDAEAGIRIADATDKPQFAVNLLRLGFDDCEDGVFMGGPVDCPCDLLIDSCVFGRLAANGLEDGQSHDVYAGGLSVTIRRSIFYGNSKSNAIKIRGKFLLLEDNMIGRSNNRWVDLPGNTNVISNRNTYFTLMDSNNGNCFGFADEPNPETINPGKAGSFISTDDTFYITRSTEYIWINAINFVVSFIRPKVYWVGAQGSTPPTVQITGPGGIAGPNPFVFTESNRRDALPAMPADPTP